MTVGGTWHALILIFQKHALFLNPLANLKPRALFSPRGDGQGQASALPSTEVSLGGVPAPIKSSALPRGAAVPSARPRRITWPAKGRGSIAAKTVVRLLWDPVVAWKGQREIYKILLITIGAAESPPPPKIDYFLLETFNCFKIVGDIWAVTTGMLQSVANAFGIAPLKDGLSAEHIILETFREELLNRFRLLGYPQAR